MIKTFEQYNELDPYGEEDWNEYEYIKATPDNIKIGDDLYTGEELLGKIVNIDSKEVFIDIHSEDPFEGPYRTVYPIGFFKNDIFNLRIRIKINESAHEDIDPYGEEDWNEYGYDINLDNIKVGDEIYSSSDTYIGNVTKIFEDEITIVDRKKNRGITYIETLKRYRFKIKKKSTN